MTQINIEDQNPDITRLLDLIVRGEEVIFSQAGTPKARLVHYIPIEPLIVPDPDLVQFEKADKATPKKSQSTDNSPKIDPMLNEERAGLSYQTGNQNLRSASQKYSIFVESLA